MKNAVRVFELKGMMGNVAVVLRGRTLWEMWLWC